MKAYFSGALFDWLSTFQVNAIAGILKFYFLPWHVSLTCEEISAFLSLGPLSSNQVSPPLPLSPILLFIFFLKSHPFVPGICFPAIVSMAVPFICFFWFPSLISHWNAVFCSQVIGSHSIDYYLISATPKLPSACLVQTSISSHLSGRPTQIPL